MPYPAPVTLIDFALALVAADFKAFKPWEWEQLRDELTQAVGEDRPGVTAMRAGILVSSHFDGPGPKDYPRKEFVELQADVAVVLRTLAQRQRMQGVELGPLRFLTVPYRNQQIIRVQGTVRNTFLFVLFSAIAQLDKPLVLSCRECTTLFRAERKRLYCSRRCASRASMRRWKARHQTPTNRRRNRKSSKP